MALQGHLFQCRWKAIWDYILIDYNFGLMYKISKYIATARSKNGNFRRQYSHLMRNDAPPPPANPHEYRHNPYTLERLLHDDLHWLDVPERVQFKLGLTVRRCLRRRAPRYLVDYCTSVSDVVSRQHLKSSTSRRQLVCRVTVSTRWAVGPSQWLVRRPGTHYRTVSASRRVMTTFQTTVSNIHWKHFSLVDINVLSAVEVLMTLRYINVHSLTYLLQTFRAGTH